MLTKEFTGLLTSITVFGVTDLDPNEEPLRYYVADVLHMPKKTKEALVKATFSRSGWTIDKARAQYHNAVIIKAVKEYKDISYVCYSGDTPVITGRVCSAMSPGDSITLSLHIDVADS